MLFDNWFATFKFKNREQIWIFSFSTKYLLVFLSYMEFLKLPPGLATDNLRLPGIQQQQQQQGQQQHQEQQRSIEYCDSLATTQQH